MVVPIDQLENEVRVAGICDVDSFVLLWYDVCNGFIVCRIVGLR